MMIVDHTIKITISEEKYFTISKDEAEQLYTLLSNALNKTLNSNIYYPPNARNGNNTIYAGGANGAQGAL